MIDIGNLKNAREVLCDAQMQFMWNRQVSRTPKNLDFINDLIVQIDVMRPLGSDGKHGNLHTELCGCEDKNLEDEEVIEWREIPFFPNYLINKKGIVKNRFSDLPLTPQLYKNTVYVSMSRNQIKANRSVKKLVREIFLDE